MNMKRIGALALALSFFGLGPMPARAGGRHYHYRGYHGYHWGRGWYGGPRVSVGFYGPGPRYYAPYGYPRYYAPAYYGAPAVVYSRPVVVERETRVVSAAAPARVETDVQRELARRGYYGGVIDGDIGPQTRAAIRAYQVDKGLPVTGRIDGNLLRSLRLL